MAADLKVAVIGLGYFSQFHLGAWQSDPLIGHVAATDLNPDRRVWAEETYDVAVFHTVAALLAAADFDIVDIVAPPPAHKALVLQSLRAGRIIVCQKPFCTSLEEATEVAAAAKAAGAKLVIHENFRFQPWHRTTKAVLEADGLGQIFQAQFNLRPGDGRGADAYLSRQPAFRSMERLLIHETGVHFVDLFQWLFGDITSVYADLTQLNPAIKAEDSGLLVMEHASGARSTFDGNRLSDHITDNPRRTMGEMWVEGEKGTLRLDGQGQVFIRAFGDRNERHIPHSMPVDEETFGGGCVANLCRHVSAAAVGQGALENEATDYLSVIKATDAAYRSDAAGKKIHLQQES